MVYRDILIPLCFYFVEIIYIHKLEGMNVVLQVCYIIERKTYLFDKVNNDSYY